MSDLTYLSAASMAAMVRSRKISPVELVEAHLARVERVNPVVNAFVQMNSGAREAARRAEEAMMRGDELRPLHGVPISIKSSICVAAMRCEAGSRLREGQVAEEDAPLVTRLRDAGAIILGTTNAPEFLMAWETDNLLYGRTNNPWDVTRTAGGSSGGEAAAIAAGCSAGGVGSDGGGSIREPAHFSGICGLKPTPGRIPATGHFPNSVGPFALTGVVGPMARTVTDVKLLFEAMQGPDDGDPSAAPVPVRWPDATAIRKLRIGYFEDDGRTPVTAETRAAVRTAAKALRDAGFVVEAFRPQGLEKARQLWWKYFGIAGGMLLRPMIEAAASSVAALAAAKIPALSQKTRPGRGTRDPEISPLLEEFMQWVAEEPTHTGDTLLDAWIERDVVRMQVFKQMQEYPILLCPVAAIPAFRHGERSWQIDGKEVKYLDAWSYTEWFNLLGNPAVAVPVAQSSAGLPVGVQLAARPWDEELLLSVAAQLEAQLGPYPHPSM